MVINRYKSFVDKISDYNNYDNNIRRFLYLIVPAFIIKYGYKKEGLIINTFTNVKIFVSNEESDMVNAFYTSIPRYDMGKIVTNKMIVIKNYNKIKLVNLLDSLVHEFNHAVNSYNYEFKIDDNNLYLRTGLTYSIYDKTSLKPIKKDESYVLEEIINTRQTESIINIIRDFDINNNLVSNTIYSINSEVSNNYNSMAYFYESAISKRILDNKTFISTIENLRISGSIDDIEGWFDNIVGENGVYKKLVLLLKKILDMEIELSKTKYFKSFKINKIKDMSRSVIDIVNTFDNSTNYS